MSEENFRVVQILLMSLGLIATFGGAGLGALLSGRYAVRVSKNQYDREVERHEKRAEYIKEKYIKKYARLMADLRPQDFGHRIKIMNDEGPINLNPTFRENAYVIHDPFILRKIEKLVLRMEDFRVSDGFFYLEESEIDALDELIDNAEEVSYLFQKLNKLKNEAYSEEDEKFKVVKNKAFDSLDKFYTLNTNDKEISLDNRKKKS